MENIYDIEFLIPLILLRGELGGIKGGMVRFQIAKVTAGVLVNSNIFSVQKNVFIYRYGPYILKFEDALANLVRRDILEIITDSEGQKRICITNEGKRWILSRLRDQNHRKGHAVIEEIDRCIFTSIPDLIIEIAEKSPLLHPVKHSIGDKELVKVFDWTNFGDGKVHGYHYTLLRSFYRLENHFREEFKVACDKIEAGETDCRYRVIDYAAIPDVMTSEDIFEYKREKYTMKYVFNKNDPKSIKEDKFEGKNYIGNLWYIHSAINIIHILAGLAPTINEVARICLTSYEFAMEKDIPFPKLRRMRESAIRPDIHNLVKFGLLNKKKIDKYNVYTIRAKKIIDTFTSNTYSLLREDKVQYLYNEMVRPDDKNMEILNEIMSNERKLHEAAQVAGG